MFRLTNFNRLFFATAWIAGVAVLASVNANGQTDEAKTENMDSKVQELVEKLNSNRFTERARAGRELEQLGPAANLSLERVTQNGSSDAANRAFQILVKNSRSKTPEIADKAKQTLQRIAADIDNPKSSSAKSYLEPVKEVEPPMPTNRLGQPIQIRIQRGGVPALPLQIKGAQIQNIRMSVKSVNGKREIEVEQNGRKFKFKEDGDAIQVERPDDKGGIKKAKYKNKEELKKKDAEAYKWFEQASGKKFSKQFRIQIGGQLGPPIQPVIPRFQIGPQKLDGKLQELKPAQPAAEPNAPKQAIEPKPVTPAPADKPAEKPAEKPLPKDAKNLDDVIDL